MDIFNYELVDPLTYVCSFLNLRDYLSFLTTCKYVKKYVSVYRNEKIAFHYNLNVVRLSYHGHHDAIEWVAMKYCQCDINFSTFNIVGIAIHGYFSTIDWLLQKYNKSYDILAIRNLVHHIGDIGIKGHVDMIEWILDKNKKFEMKYLNFKLRKIANHGSLKMLKWIHERKIQEMCSDNFDFETIVINGHLHVLKWLMEHIKYNFTSKMVTEAIVNHRIEIVKWMYNIKPNMTFTKTHYNNMIQSKSVDVFNWYLTYNGKRYFPGYDNLFITCAELGSFSLCHGIYDRIVDVNTVRKLITICVDYVDYDSIKLLTDKYPNIGCHPRAIHDLETSMLLNHTQATLNEMKNIYNIVKTYVVELYVPYRDRKIVAKSSCIWDPSRYKWFTDIGNKEMIDRYGQNLRIYLDVPYREKDEAKRLGCYWDPKAKKWYIDEHNEEIIQKWSLKIEDEI